MQLCQLGVVLQNCRKGLTELIGLPLQRDCDLDTPPARLVTQLKLRKLVILVSCRIVLALLMVKLPSCRDVRCGIGTAQLRAAGHVRCLRPTDGSCSLQPTSIKSHSWCSSGSCSTASAAAPAMSSSRLVNCWPRCCSHNCSPGSLIAGSSMQLRLVVARLAASAHVWQTKAAASLSSRSSSCRIKAVKAEGSLSHCAKYRQR